MARPLGALLGALVGGQVGALLGGVASSRCRERRSAGRTPGCVQPRRRQRTRARPSCSTGTACSPISPLHLPYISPISPLHLPYISRISPHLEEEHARVRGLARQHDARLWAAAPAVVSHRTTIALPSHSKLAKLRRAGHSWQGLSKYARCAAVPASPRQTHRPFVPERSRGGGGMVVSPRLPRSPSPGCLARPHPTATAALHRFRCRALVRMS